MKTQAHRFHDFCCGHRVYRHESKCAHLHGHNYRVHFTVESPQLDAVGRVLDFGDIKWRLCQWLENHWDHKMLLWKDDPWAYKLLELDDTVVVVPFNPTAENMAAYLLNVVGPKQLALTDPPVTLTEVRIEETRKCHATVRLN